MGKNDKIIIIGLIVVIIALIAGLAYMFMGNNLSASDGNVPNGMQRYNFDSIFTMTVPKNVKFLKEFNATNEFGQAATYFDSSDEFAISYMYSPMITHEFINYTETFANASGNSTFEFEGDLVIAHNLKNNGKIGNDFESSNFTYMVLVQRGHEIVSINGNDLDSIKSMIKTLEWYE